MKKTHITTFCLLISISLVLLTNCERDDICAEATPTTPNIGIEFYDNSNPENLKNVPDLLIIGEGQTEPVAGAAINSISSISLPLRTDAEETVFFMYESTFINDANTPDDTTDDFVDGNIDKVTFNYTTEEVYVSRACGFKTIFTNLTVTVEVDTDNWIQNISIEAENQTIQDESQAHIFIRH